MGKLHQRAADSGRGAHRCCLVPSFPPSALFGSQRFGAAAGVAAGPRRRRAECRRGGRRDDRARRRIWPTCARARRGCATRVWNRPDGAAPAAGCRSPIRARSSSRSPICAATTATTAPSSPCRASCVPRARHVHGTRRDPRRRPPRRRTRLQGSAIHPRRPPRGSLAGGARVARRTWLRLHAVLPAGDGDPGAGGNRAAAAPEPRRDELVGDVAAQAGGAVDGHDAGDHVAAAVRDERAGSLWQPG